MTKEELEAAQKLIDTPITAENVDEPLEAVFPTKQPTESLSEKIGWIPTAGCDCVLCKPKVARMEER